MWIRRAGGPSHITSLRCARRCAAQHDQCMSKQQPPLLGLGSSGQFYQRGEVPRGTTGPRAGKPWAPRWCRGKIRRYQARIVHEDLTGARQLPGGRDNISSTEIRTVTLYVNHNTMPTLISRVTIYDSAVELGRTDTQHASDPDRNAGGEAALHVDGLGAHSDIASALSGHAADAAALRRRVNLSSTYYTFWGVVIDGGCSPDISGAQKKPRPKTPTTGHTTAGSPTRPCSIKPNHMRGRGGVVLRPDTRPWSLGADSRRNFLQGFLGGGYRLPTST